MQFFSHTSINFFTNNPKICCLCQGLPIVPDSLIWGLFCSSVGLLFWLHGVVGFPVHCQSYDMRFLSSRSSLMIRLAAAPSVLSQPLWSRAASISWISCQSYRRTSQESQQGSWNRLKLWKQCPFCVSMTCLKIFQQNILVCWTLWEGQFCGKSGRYLSG